MDSAPALSILVQEDLRKPFQVASPIRVLDIFCHILSMQFQPLLNGKIVVNFFLGGVMGFLGPKPFRDSIEQSQDDLFWCEPPAGTLP